MTSRNSPLAIGQWNILTTSMMLWGVCTQYSVLSSSHPHCHVYLRTDERRVREFAEGGACRISGDGWHGHSSSGFGDALRRRCLVEPARSNGGQASRPGGFCNLPACQRTCALLVAFWIAVCSVYPHFWGSSLPYDCINTLQQAESERIPLK